jgi:hypothetical protein
VRLYLTINNLNVSAVSQNEGLLTREVSGKKTRCCSFISLHVLHVQKHFGKMSFVSFGNSNSGQSDESREREREEGLSNRALREVGRLASR